MNGEEVVAYATAFSIFFRALADGILILGAAGVIWNMRYIIYPRPGNSILNEIAESAERIEKEEDGQ